VVGFAGGNSKLGKQLYAWIRDAIAGASIEPNRPTEDKPTRGFTKEELDKSSVQFGNVAHERYFSLKENGELPFKADYIDSFLRWDCGLTLLNLSMFPKNDRTKEISESMACLAAVDKHLSDILHFKDEKVLCLVVGDGSTPRTAALLAFRTRWARIISVDPALSASPELAKKWEGVARLQLSSKRIQDCTFEVDDEKHVLLVLPHAHVSADVALGSLHFKPGVPLPTISIVQLPCCWVLWHEQVCGKHADKSFKDPAVFATARCVKVWQDVSADAVTHRAVGIGDQRPRTEQLLTRGIATKKEWLKSQKRKKTARQQDRKKRRAIELSSKLLARGC
jgi:hypothetical protein